MKIEITGGMIIAFILSYLTNHSWAWAIVHGILSWLYVIYWILKHFHF